MALAENEATQHSSAAPPEKLLPENAPKAHTPRVAPSLQSTSSPRRMQSVARGFTKTAASQKSSLPDPRFLAAIFEGLRSQTRALTVPLTVEDQNIQSMDDASPTKWHLAHTTWFFETFVLAKFQPVYQAFDDNYQRLFNSYYESVGPRHPRSRRGMLTRPSCDDIIRYRAHVDEHMATFMAGPRASAAWEQVAPLVMLGCHHEQQHQELILMDILHAFSCNPTWPVYAARPVTQPSAHSREATPLRWINFPGGDYEIGHHGSSFAFDNEGPRHTVKLQPFAIGSRAVTNGEWLAFMAAGGYERPEFWLSDGWDTVQKNGWKTPQYWMQIKDSGWLRFTLGGLAALDLAAPVCHISFYEADAYARWAGKRFPTEAEWEAAAVSQTSHVTPQLDLSTANFLESGVLEPIPPAWGEGHGPQQMFGDVWEWTQSPYSPYPGFKASKDAVGEYNAKFMINQMVLRGGSCVTPASHVRATYRNYFYPHMRWQFSGLRLADSL